jgi:hypothetical protein
MLNKILVISLIFLSGCTANLPVTGYPDYTHEYLICVADEHDALVWQCPSDPSLMNASDRRGLCKQHKGVYGECTREAMKDWQVLVGL